MVEAGIQTVASLQGSNHLITVNDPTHLTASAGGIHILATQGKGTSWIQSKTWFNRGLRVT